MKRIILVLLTIMLTLASCSVGFESDGSDNSVSDILSDDMNSSDMISADTSFNSESGDITSENDDSENLDVTSEFDNSSSDDNDESNGDDEAVNNYTYFKGVWLTQFDLYDVYLENGNQRDKDSFAALMKNIFLKLKDDGYNSVIVQVRPYADSYYPSEYYPVSNYVSGAFGREDIYDPIEILVPLARECGLEFHAWLNPMRGMKVSEIQNVPDGYPIKKWYNDVELRNKYLSVLNDRIYLNPAHEEVRSLIANGAAEVVSRYDVDGVHIDDYFYPTTDVSFDDVSFNDYRSNGGALSLDEYRRYNLDLMVSLMYTAIKNANPDAVFGISPAGNIDNTYKLMYADVYKWCSEIGYLDYICPQIYFGLEHSTHDFKKIYDVWASNVKQDSIKLYVGMTLGKAVSGVDNYAGNGKFEWRDNKDVLKRCIEFLNEQEDCRGIAMFCYQHMYNPLTGESVSDTFEERNNLKNSLIMLGSD